MNISAFNRLLLSQISFFQSRLLIGSVKVCLILCLSFGMVIDIKAEKTAADTISEEKHWAEQLRDKIISGRPVDLPLASSASEESSFFAIFSPHTTAKPKGAIIIMHSSGAHPDRKDVIQPLRINLPDKGWATLSIQLPLTASDTKSEEADFQSKKQAIAASLPRIDEAVKFLKSESYHPVVLLSHGFGSLMALNFLQLKMGENPAKSPDGSLLISGAVIIGTPSYGTAIPLNSPALIEKMQGPLLDIFGSNDLDTVLRSAKARKTAAHKTENRQYRQVETIGADHIYSALDEELLAYISAWLNKNITRTQQ